MSIHNGSENATVNVAILGLGRIAERMAATLAGMKNDARYSEAVSLYTAATRDDPQRAQGFAEKYGFAHAYGSYDELLNDEAADLVYIATPHAFHAEQAIACMEHGKNVLVEKSFTATEEQARKVIEVSHRTGMLCAEAIWTRYMPSRRMILDAMAGRGEEGIGPVHAVHADLSYPITYKERIVEPALAGGALLDVGVYTLNFVRMLFPDADPHDIMTAAKLTEKKVDESNVSAIWLDNGVKATVTSAIDCTSDRNGVIQGENGHITVDNINNPGTITVYNKAGEAVRTLSAPEQITGFEYEVMASIDAIRRNAVECPEMPHEETLFIMRLMDALRHNWGVWYPFEKQGQQKGV